MTGLQQWWVKPVVEAVLCNGGEEHPKEEVTEIMAKTMEQYMSKTRADYGSRISRPKIDEKDRFELKGQFLKELHDNTFSDSDHEDVNEHIEKVLEIVDLFHIPNITQDQVMLRAFPMSLTRVASHWLRNKLSAIQVQLNNLRREIKKVNEKVYAAQVGCEQCKGPHYTKYFPLKEEGASVSVMPLSTYLNLSLGELAHTKLTVELTNRPVKYLKGIAKNVLVGIGKFIFLIEFIILDMPEDVKVSLILRRPFLSTAHAKNDVFKKKITLKVRDEKIIFKSVKPASCLIKRVYMLSLRESMELDLEAMLIGETLVLNTSLDPLYGDYIELNDLNVPLELRRDQVDDLMPTIEEVVENMDSYRDQDMRDIILGEPFCKASCVEAKRLAKGHAFWSLNEGSRINTPYPEKTTKDQGSIRRIQRRPQRIKDQYTVSREDHKGSRINTPYPEKTNMSYSCYGNNISGRY
nr:hypothetical protein [Tanacetum cinerariifolium]